MAKKGTTQAVADFKFKFGANLRRARKKSGQKVVNIAKWLNISTTMYGYYEAGISSPSLDKIVPLCNILEITPNELFNFEINERNEQIKAFCKRYKIKYEILNNSDIRLFFSGKEITASSEDLISALNAFDRTMNDIPNKNERELAIFESILNFVQLTKTAPIKLGGW